MKYQVDCILLLDRSTMPEDICYDFLDIDRPSYPPFGKLQQEMIKTQHIV